MADDVIAEHQILICIIFVSTKYKETAKQGLEFLPKSSSFNTRIKIVLFIRFEISLKALIFVGTNFV